jgi:hypothetical protein
VICDIHVMDGYDLPPRPALRATPADYSVLPLHAEPLAVKGVFDTGHFPWPELSGCRFMCLICFYCSSARLPRCKNHSLSLSLLSLWKRSRVSFHRSQVCPVLVRATGKDKATSLSPTVPFTTPPPCPLVVVSSEIHASASRRLPYE